jgi:hypothetical protein
VHVAPIASDEQKDERVLRTVTLTAMGAHLCGRRSEVVVDPLRDEASLFGLAHAQHADELRLEVAEHCHQVGRRVGVVFKDES